jgi:hypothetical protein
MVTQTCFHSPLGAISAQPPSVQSRLEVARNNRIWMSFAVMTNSLAFSLRSGSAQVSGGKVRRAAASKS